MTSFGADLSRVRRDACTEFTDQQGCEDLSSVADNCVWVPTVWGDYHPADFSCRTMNCGDLTAVGVGDLSGECTAQGCTWHEKEYYCQPPGTTMPCGLYYEV